MFVHVSVLTVLLAVVTLEMVLAAVLALTGFPALFAVLVNVGKALGLPDGLAPVVSFGLNLLLFVFVGVMLFLGKDVMVYDQLADTVSKILALVLQLLGGVLFTKLWHEGLKRTDIPLLGTSYSRRGSRVAKG